jgi:Ser/Thr protein kinase RdoA (MazF antagonist)
MDNEASLLRSLCVRGFTQLARPEPTAAGQSSYRELETGWTRYEWIQGAALDDANIESASLAGQLLANLHNCGSDAGALTPTRLASVAPSFAQLRPLVADWSCTASLAEQVRELDARRSVLDTLPRAIIHGDFILDNIVVDATRARLVDFEFVRHDIRIFDLAPRIAPRRLASGAFELASPRFVEALVSAYASALHEPLTEVERVLLPRVVVAHWLLVAADLAKRDLAAARMVLPVLERACQMSTRE